MAGERPLSPLDAALRQFEAIEANLTKLERVWTEIDRLTPSGLEFGRNSDYDRCCREFDIVVQHLSQAQMSGPVHLRRVTTQ